MFQRKLMQEQLQLRGLRIGDDCCIYPMQGRKKKLALNRSRLDFVSPQYRSKDMTLSPIELPHYGAGPFHYRLELDETSPKVLRFLLRTLQGRPFLINGMAVREAYVERSDRIYLEDHRLSFLPATELGQTVKLEHPILGMRHLLTSDLKILITGETGTGKTHLARRVHQESGRAGQFIAVNLSSFNSMLIESELFGHKKGSFTGAMADREGAFASAENGTLFLDEIDSLPLELQTKLLTFLDNMSYRKVGESIERAIRTRLIFASGCPLEAMVKKGEFRRDLYYRLRSGHAVILEPLRNTSGAIANACDHYAEKYGIAFTPRLMEFYKTLPWPGNLRQFFGHLDKKRVLSRISKLDFDESDEELLQSSSDLMNMPELSGPVTMAECKVQHVKRTLNACGGNVAMAARRLVLTEKTVRGLILKI
jgi:DNA-binding NtrC family response regulator